MFSKNMCLGEGKTLLAVSQNNVLREGSCACEQRIVRKQYTLKNCSRLPIEYLNREDAMPACSALRCSGSRI